MRYASQLLAVFDEGDRAAILRRREIIGLRGGYQVRDVVVRLDRVSADEVAGEGAQVGFAAGDHMFVRGTDQYLGATVVALRAPLSG